MAFLSPGDLCGIEPKFMCIFSPLFFSLSLQLVPLLVRCCFSGFSFHFSAVTKQHSTPEYCPPLPLIFPFAYSLVSIIISCFVAFSFCFCFAFDFNFSFHFFFGHFRPKFWPCFFRFCSVCCHALFLPNAALGNCVWNRE